MKPRQTAERDPRFAHSLSLRICVWPADAPAAGTFAPALRAWRIAALSAESSRILAAESSMASPQLPPPASSSAELPADMLPLVFARLGGDVAALCASACVSKGWHDTLLSTAPAWESLVAGRAALRMTDARLLSLVARSRGGLRNLDLSGCTALSDFGVSKALRMDHLSHLSVVGCCNLNVETLVNMTLKYRPKLDSLRVRGLMRGGHACQDFAVSDTGDEQAAMDLVERERTMLKEMLHEPHDLDVTVGCMHAGWPYHGLVNSQGMHGVCGRMCNEEDRACSSCFTYRCIAHRYELTFAPPTPTADKSFEQCACCGKLFCKCCVEAEELEAEETYGEQLLCGHTCSSCTHRHCMECVQLDSVQPFAACGGCGKSVCDACMKSGKHSGICRR